MVSFYLEKDLYKWLLGIDDKLIQFYRKHLIQFPAYALCRRKRRSCLRNDYVCQFYFCCDLFWIFHRQCPYCQLPLWRTKSQRIKETFKLPLRQRIKSKISFAYLHPLIEFDNSLQIRLQIHAFLTRSKRYDVV